MELNKVLSDPLDEKNILPKFAHTLKFNHWSPTSLNLGDGPFIFKYLVLSQELRRLLPKNSQMMAGVCVGNSVQLHLADTLWKFNSAKKLAPVKHEPLSKDAALQKALEEFKEYKPVDDKDQTKKDHYLSTIPLTVNSVFDALEMLGVEHPVTCEKHISKTCDGLLVPIVGRTDFQFGSLPGDAPSVISSNQSSGSFLVELKTVWDRFGKVKKSGDYTLLHARLPATPSEVHLTQVAFYSAVYDFKFRMFLVYAKDDEYKIFDSSNCDGLTKQGLKENFNKLVSIAKRRERMLSRYNELEKEEIIENIVADTDPNFSHPYFWSIGPEFLKQAKELWRIA